MVLKLEKLRVLVIEDNEAMRKLILGVLENLGIGRLSNRSNALDIFQAITEFEPDVIISDWQMDKMSGIELTTKVRKDPKSPNRFIPIVLITGYNSKHRVEQARDAGVTEFLIKPFRAEDVARRLTHVINHPRDFVDASTFFGPNRRRRADEKATEKRRKEDKDLEVSWS